MPSTRVAPPLRFLTIVGRFVGAACIGLAIAFTILMFLIFFDEKDHLSARWTFHMFWVLPLAWGLAGIFWFNHMIEMGENFVCYIFDWFDWHPFGDGPGD